MRELQPNRETGEQYPENKYDDRRPEVDFIALSILGIMDSEISMSLRTWDSTAMTLKQHQKNQMKDQSMHLEEISHAPAMASYATQEAVHKFPL